MTEQEVDALRAWVGRDVRLALPPVVSHAARPLATSEPVATDPNIGLLARCTSICRRVVRSSGGGLSAKP